jgi:hypothetical protein
VVVAEDSPAAGQCLPEQLTGALEVAEHPVGRSEVVHRSQGVEVVIAQHLAGFYLIECESLKGEAVGLPLPFGINIASYACASRVIA